MWVQVAGAPSTIMIAIPTLELRNGVGVSPPSVNGSDATPEHQSADALTLARTWAHAGFRRLHLIDIDAEFGAGSNANLVEDIIRDGALEIQAGGGIQSTSEIERLADAGASRVVVGVRALHDPEWLGRVAELFPGSIVVATEVRERRVVTRNWARAIPLDILDLADEFDGMPLAGLLVGSCQVDLSRTGAELSMLEDLADACEFPVMAGGGVANLNDLRALENRRVAAVVLGSALCGGTLDVRAIAREFGG
jgi:phosphoribosylformimino-5-aminoimidazole carboxamide ribotide isomerase